MLLDLLAAGLDPIELPVALTVGDPAAGAQPEQIGTVHVAMHAAPAGTVPGEQLVRLTVTDPDDVRHQLAALLDRYTAGLRAETDEEVPGAAPRQ